MANFGVATCSLPRAGARVVHRAAVTEGIAMRFPFTPEFAAASARRPLRLDPAPPTWAWMIL